MSESGLNSETETDSSEEDPSYDYTGEDTGLSEEEVDRGEESDSEEEEEDDIGSSFPRREQIEDEWQYCEQGVPPRRLEPPQVYAPERGPPLLDFMFVLTAFCAAVFAAYYTIFTETGVS